MDDKKPKQALEELFSESVPIEGMVFPGDRLIEDEVLDSKVPDSVESDELPQGWRVKSLGNEVLKNLPKNFSSIEEAIASAAEKLGVSVEEARQAYESVVYGR